MWQWASQGSNCFKRLFVFLFYGFTSQGKFGSSNLLSEYNAA